MAKQDQELIATISDQKKLYIRAVMEFVEKPTTSRFFNLVNMACEMIAACNQHPYHYSMSILSGQIGIHDKDDDIPG